MPYLAPELLRGGEASPQTDVYATGVLLFTLCTGQLPFHDRRPQALMASILENGVPPLGNEAPPELARVVEKATAKDAAQRFVSAAELRRALVALGLAPVDLGPINVPDVTVENLDTRPT
jgi:serine/threonine-protein kinase